MPDSVMLTVAREGDAAVVLVNRTSLAKLTLPRWSVALAFGQALAYQARGVYGPDAQTVAGATLRRDGDFEVVSVGPTVFAVMPLELALVVAHAVIGKAREVETEEDPEGLILDQALLQRTNVLPGLGLSSDPRILEEAGKEAAWNSDLRRWVPGGVRRQRHVGTPTVRKEK